MGDLAEDTALDQLGDGRYRATLSRDWEIWGPMGGYVAACALRAAGDASSQPLPASFSCHYLGVARFEPIDIRVEPRREGRAATSQRVEVTQSGRAVLDAMVWGTSEGPGLEHDETVPPDVPSPDDLPGRPPDSVRPYRFWDNLESRPGTSRGGSVVHPQSGVSSPRATSAARLSTDLSIMLFGTIGNLSRACSGVLVQSQ
jgi:acyl-CoA thioesterase II